MLRTMYGLSFTASLLCASATRRFASATLLDKSSVVFGETERGADVARGVPSGLGVAMADAEMEAEAEEEAVGAPFFIAAILAAISARFCAMRSAVAWQFSVSPALDLASEFTY